MTFTSIQFIVFLIFTFIIFYNVNENETASHFAAQLTCIPTFIYYAKHLIKRNLTGNEFKEEILDG